MSHFPRVIEPGYSTRIAIENSAHHLLVYPGGVAQPSRTAFEHECTRTGAEDSTLIAAPFLQIANGGHDVNMEDGIGKITVTPSILCDRCGTHGFIRKGEWFEA